MPISEVFLAEWDQEVAATRRLLERVPPDKLARTPHDKSYSLRQLAGHLAQLHGWTAITLKADEFDVNPPEGGDYPQPTLESTGDILALFDQTTAEARNDIAATSDETFGETWTFKNGGETVFAAPKAGVLRRFVMNHVIHHRGQLTVYLRLLDVPLPQTFGPSADEPEF